MIQHNINIYLFNHLAHFLNQKILKKKKMSKLNNDILYLITKELQNDNKTLYSCLTVNKSWCEIIIPILWKDPWKAVKYKKKLLLNIIISHLPKESKNNLRSQRIYPWKILYQRPLFNYISFCKH